MWRKRQRGTANESTNAWNDVFVAFRMTTSAGKTDFHWKFSPSRKSRLAIDTRQRSTATNLFESNATHPANFCTQTRLLNCIHWLWIGLSAEKMAISLRLVVFFFLISGVVVFLLLVKKTRSNKKSGSYEKNKIPPIRAIPTWWERFCRTLLDSIDSDTSSRSFPAYSTGIVGENVLKIRAKFILFIGCVVSSWRWRTNVAKNESEFRQLDYLLWCKVEVFMLLIDIDTNFWFNY